MTKAERERRSLIKEVLRDTLVYHAKELVRALSGENAVPVDILRGLLKQAALMACVLEVEDDALNDFRGALKAGADTRMRQKGSVRKTPGGETIN